MILEEATHEAFGYYSKDLKLKSHKVVLATCDGCGKLRVIGKGDYCDLCPSCAQIGNTRGLGYKHTEEHKAKIGAIQTGRRHTKETKALMSKNHADVNGEKNPSWRGGRRAARARSYAKRKRQLGYKLLLPLRKGEVGHHVTNECVLGIPAEVHQKRCGGSWRKKHRTLILQWLKIHDKKKYKLALCVLAREPLHMIQRRETL